MIVEFNIRDGGLIIISNFSTSSWGFNKPVPRRELRFIESIPSGVSSAWYIGKLKIFLTYGVDRV